MTQCERLFDEFTRGQHLRFTNVMLQYKYGEDSSSKRGNKESFNDLVIDFKKKMVIGRKTF